MSRLRSTILAAALVASTGLAHGAAAAYTILSKISRVSFELEHQGFIQLFGTLHVTPGTFVFDNDDWSKSQVDVAMPIKTLDMGDELWNSQIRGDDSWAGLFQSSAIAFRSTQLHRVDATHGTMTGELTLAGVTKPVTLQLRVNKIGSNEVLDKPAVGFGATTTIKRSDFGIDAYEGLVGDEIAVRIQIEAVEGPDPDAAPETATKPAR